MGKLIYSMIVSLDGYVADQYGNFDWAMPDEDVMAAVNSESSQIGTYLYGRRMYQVMEVCESDPNIAGDSPGAKASAKPSVDGPTLAAEAFRHRLVDRIHLLVCPVVVGLGLSFLPDVRLNLELMRHQPFDNGMVSLQYRLDASPEHSIIFKE